MRYDMWIWLILYDGRGQGTGPVQRIVDESFIEDYKVDVLGVVNRRGSNDDVGKSLILILQRHLDE